MTDLIPIRSQDITRDWVALMAPAVELAKQVANTSFVPQGLRNDPPAIVAAILYGDEIGFGPMQALAKIAVINGRPTLAAEGQRAKILADGHEFWIVEANTTKVTVAGRRRGSDQTSTVTWTLDDAKRAGLAGKQNWRLYPRQMLLARASAELARLIFADSIGGLYATEELEEGDVDFNGEVETKTTPAATTKRRRRQTTAVPAESSADAVPNVPTPERPPFPEELAAAASEDPPAAEVVEDGAPAGEPDPAAEEMSGGVSGPTQQSAGAGLGDDEPASAPPDADGATDAQKKKANVLVGRLRERGHITTENLYMAVASQRDKSTEELIDFLGGGDMDGTLHWAPLRDQLTKTEISSLIDRLERFEQAILAREAEGDA